MSVIANNSRSKSMAEMYINKALALNSSYESVQKILAQLNTMEEDEGEPSPEIVESPDREDAERSSKM